MVIDLILNRKDGAPYNAHKFYREILQYGEVGGGIAEALDSAGETGVKFALCRYVIDNGYNPAISEYIASVDWLPTESQYTKH